MKRKKPASVPSHCRHDCTGQGYVRLNGKFHYTGVYGTPESEQRYQQIVAEWLAAGKPVDFSLSDKPKADERLTLVELAADYWRHCQAYYVKNGKPTDEQSYVRSALRYVRVMFGDSAVDDFGPLKLQKIQQQMVDDGLSRKYINKQSMRLKSMFSWGVTQEMVASSVADALRHVPGLRKGRTAARETAKIQPVSDDDLEATLDIYHRRLPPWCKYSGLLACVQAKFAR